MINKQIEESEHLFLTTFNNKSSIILYPIENSVQNEVPLVNRIVHDSVGQLNSQSIILDGSSRTLKCNRVQHDDISLPNCFLFFG